MIFSAFLFFEKNSQQKESNFYKKTICIFLVYFYNKFDEILREKRADEWDLYLTLISESSLLLFIRRRRVGNLSEIN